MSDAIDRGSLELLLETVGGDLAFFGELLEAFFEDAPQQMAQAEQAVLAGGDYETLRRAAHSLKSNSLNFGAIELSRMCKELEDAAKAGTLEGVEEQLDQIRAEYARAAAALKATVAGG
jgi:HPt (histidine-containing phosphotransfer) domain-containing protein